MRETEKEEGISQGAYKEREVFVETYSAACSGFKTAWMESMVEPSPRAAKAMRFCFLTDLIQPLTWICWSDERAF